MGQRIRAYWSVVFAIFARDMRNIVRNPVALILIVGACALPSAYAWWCTAANWDPYNSTKGIRIAVANDDKGSSLAQTGQLNVGNELVEKLKGNNQLGWTFYDSSEAAINAVYAGECYAAIVVPADFSERFTSIASGNFKQPKLDYYVNEKISASAPDFTNEGISVVQDQVDQTFRSTVTEAVMEVTQKLGLTVEEKGNQAESNLTHGVATANEALQKTRETFADSIPALDSMKAAVGESDSTLSSMQDMLPELEQSIASGRESLDKTRGAATVYETNLYGALAKSAVDLGALSTQAQTDLSKAKAQLMGVYGQTSAALSKAQGVADRNEKTLAEFGPLVVAHPELQSLYNQLQTGNTNLNTAIGNMQQTNDTLQNTLSGIDELLTTVNQLAMKSSGDLSSAATQLRDQVEPALNSGLDHFSNALGTLSGLVSALKPSIEQTRAALGSLSSSLDASKKMASDADGSLAAMQGRLDNVLNDLRAAQSSALVGDLGTFLQMNPSETASFISSPVTLKSTSLYPVKNYGSGVVSFFTCVALWVAGFVFIDLFKMRVNPEGLPEFTGSQAYFGRWLLFMTLALLPSLIVCTGDLLLGIQCQNPAAFVFAGVISCLVYVNLIYALAHAFRYVGKALAVLLLIVQIPGSSGLYPVEMMPGFYQALHPLLPFTYSIGAFREAVGGFYGNHYAMDLLLLVLVFVPLGFLIGLGLGKLSANLTLLLDREISQTDMFDGERPPQNTRLRLNTLLRALMHTPAYRQELIQRVKSFNERFPRLKRIGWVLLVAQFVITFALMVIIDADVNTKLILLMIMVVGIIVVDTYLIVIAYMKASLSSKLQLADTAQDDLQDEVRALLDRKGGLA